MSALGKVKMSAFGLKLGNLGSQPNLEKTTNEQRTIFDERARDRTSQYH